MNINKILELNLRIEYMETKAGISPKQLIIKTKYGKLFRSYDSNIAFLPKDENIIYLGKDWDYSKTTSVYRNKFLNKTTKELEQMIKNKTAIIIDL